MFSIFKGTEKDHFFETNGVTTTSSANAKEASVICQKHDDCPDNEGCIGLVLGNSNTQYHTCAFPNCQGMAYSDNHVTVLKWEPAARDYCCSRGLITSTLCKDAEQIVTTSSMVTPASDTSTRVPPTYSTSQTVSRTISNTDVPLPATATNVPSTTATSTTATSIPSTTTTLATTTGIPSTTTEGVPVPSASQVTTTTSAEIDVAVSLVPTTDSKTTTTIAEMTTKATTIKMCKVQEACVRGEACVDYTGESGEQRQKCEKYFCLAMSRVVDRATLSQWSPVLRNYCCKNSFFKHIECAAVNKSDRETKIATTTNTSENTLSFGFITARTITKDDYFNPNGVVIACIVIGAAAMGAFTLVYLMFFVLYICAIRKKKQAQVTQIIVEDKDDAETTESHEMATQTNVQLHFDQPYSNTL